MAAPAAESKEPEKENPNPWEEFLRKMLPEGAPLPNEDQLDFSISVDYVGPSPFFRPPANPLVPKTRFSPFPKRPASLSPRNPSWMKSRSSTDTASSVNKRNSASSAAFDIVTDDISKDGGEEAIGDSDHHDRDEYPSLNERERERDTEREVCVSYCGWRIGRGCTRCGKKQGLLGLREACIVCGAEYCVKCVLKAMGSMPEGRKCVGCIRRPIDESCRGRLGKGSRVLARLWSPSQVKEIMRVERECRANRVRPELVIVNGRELRENELEELLHCALPPRDLRPGRYWYDKDSGLWGKEGAKPYTMVTSKLSVGGKLRVDASCGNTKVYVNGREITKFELRVFKLAKVECHRGTRFWLYEDGSYEEEGQNNIRGRIWEKASTRLLCSLFSLPIPPETPHYVKRETASITSRMFHEYLEKPQVPKLLLLGVDDSGKSTIFKQAKFIYANKFTSEELQRIKLIIQSNTFRYLCTLLEGLEWLEDEAPVEKESTCLAAGRSVPGETKCDRSEQCIYSLNQKSNNFCDWLFSLFATGDIDAVFPAAASEYAPIISEIWNDPAIQKIYKTMEELQYIPDVAKYFLDRVIEISSNEYEPSEKDILLAEGITPHNGLACAEFSLDGCSTISEIYSRLHISKYELIRLGCSKGPYNGFKWFQMFDGTSAVVFCVSLSSYDELTTCAVQNKMLATRDYFASIVQNSCFDNTPFLLLLTKYEIFEEKVNQVQLTVCPWFEDFNPHQSKGSRSALAQQAFHYIAMKFKELYRSITGRKLYVYPIRGREQGSVSEAFRYLREILTWEAVVDEHGDIYDIMAEEEVDLVSHVARRAHSPIVD